MIAPEDWDQESYCWADGCEEPATHSKLVGVTDDGTPIYELVCCAHSWEMQ